MESQGGETPERRKSRWRLLALILPLAAAAALILSYRPSLPRGGIVILFTSETRGHVVPCGCYQGQPGGIGKLPAAVGEDWRAWDTLLLDGGDFVDNPPIEGFDDRENPRTIAASKLDYLLRKHRALVRIMKTMDYQAVSPGEYDFLLGQEFVLDAYNAMENRFVCANLLFTFNKKPIFRPYRIVTVGRGSFAGIPFGGVKVGILGLLPEGTVIPPLGHVPNALTLGHPEVTARKTVQEMREKGAQIVVLLYHAPRTTVRALVKTVEGIDVAFAGHDGRGGPLDKIGSTYVADLLPGCTYVGRLVLPLESGAPGEATFEALRLAEELPEDREILAPYESFQRELAADPPRPWKLQVLEEAYVGSDRCLDCHGPTLSGIENPYDHWAGTKHSRSMEALIGKGHEGDPECLQCHTTAFGKDTGFGSAKAVGSGLGAVGCEVCHGPREKHALKWEKERAAGKILPLPVKDAQPNLHSTPCVTCHTNARDPGFANNKEKRYEAVRHRPGK